MLVAQITERWYLEGFVAAGEIAGRIPIRDLPFRIGREPGLSLSLSTKSVSMQHAEIRHVDSGLAIRDLGSTNGTFVNGKPVGPRNAPLGSGDVIHIANIEFRLGREATGGIQATIKESPCRWLAVLSRFDRLFDEGGAVPHFQPIVKLVDSRPIGFEVLARSAIEGLQTPFEMFEAATHLDMEAELSRLMRRLGARVGQTLPDRPNLFLNTHPAELYGQELFDSLRQLREHLPRQELTLEIHEAAVTSIDGMRSLGALLRELDIHLAYDDFGAGQARLVDLVEVPPDFLKFDMCLVRDIHTASSQRQKMLHSLVRIAHDLGIAAVAEGVERREEAEVCRQLGFELAQGYFFGRPAAVNAWQTPAAPR